MSVYIVKMWCYGSEYFEGKSNDYFTVADSYEKALVRLDNGEDWMIGIIAEHDLETGKCKNWKIFEQDGADITERNYDELWSEYR